MVERPRRMAFGKAAGFRGLAQWLMLLLSCVSCAQAVAQDAQPAFPDTLDRAEWQYAGRSYGGDDVYVDLRNSQRIDDDPDTVRAVLLVNRLNCGDGPVARNRAEARAQCMQSFGYASYIVGHRYWCGKDSSRAHDVETYFSISFDDYDGNGKVVRKVYAKGSPEMDTFEPDMPSAVAREWLCRSLK
ncbi:hypothetical protein [Paraburkholderia bannensis]|uniref:hypothetical protein n=1 Tax=Paraburkholderia bannensis TaxID=765414 RepID=UPI002AB72F74|nr:hypothetical protein [Paraburkholderia bannensis]